MIENIDRRVLAGFRCVDAITAASIQPPLQISGTPLVLRPTASGVFAVMRAPQMTQLTNQFVAPPADVWPSPTQWEVTIQDPTLRYLARRAMIAVPQPVPSINAGGTPAPTTTQPAGTPPTQPIFLPQDVVMYPSPAAALEPNWAVIRVSVVSDTAQPLGLPWAVVRVMGSSGTLATGVTNQNGEALLAVPGLGLSLSSSSTGSVTETTIAATITTWFDPTNLAQPKGWIPNPDAILQSLSDSSWRKASQSVQLGPGQTVFIALAISL